VCSSDLKSRYIVKHAVERSCFGRVSCIISPNKKSAREMIRQLKLELDSIYPHVAKSLPIFFIGKGITVDEMEQTKALIYVTHLPYGTPTVSGRHYKILEKLEDKFVRIRSRTIIPDHIAKKRRVDRENPPPEPFLYLIDELHQFIAKHKRKIQISQKYTFGWRGSTPISIEGSRQTNYIFLEVCSKTFQITRQLLEGYTQEDLEALNLTTIDLFGDIPKSSTITEYKKVRRAKFYFNIWDETQLKILKTYKEKVYTHLMTIRCKEKWESVNAVYKKNVDALKVMWRLMAECLGGRAVELTYKLDGCKLKMDDALYCEMDLAHVVRNKI